MFGRAGSIHTLLGLLTCCLLLYFVEYVVPPDVIFRSMSLEAWVLLETSGVRISIFKRVCRAGIVTVPTPTTRNDEPVQYYSVPAGGPQNRTRPLAQSGSPPVPTRRQRGIKVVRGNRPSRHEARLPPALRRHSPSQYSLPFPVSLPGGPQPFLFSLCQPFFFYIPCSSSWIPSSPSIFNPALAETCTANRRHQTSDRDCALPLRNRNTRS